MIIIRNSGDSFPKSPRGDGAGLTVGLDMVGDLFTILGECVSEIRWLILFDESDLTKVYRSRFRIRKNPELSGSER